MSTIEGTFQDFTLGPVAALESIKHLGMNGGGFFGANSCTPFENPTVISNIVEMLSMMILPGACVVTFGHMLNDRRKTKRETQRSTPQKKILMGKQGAVIFDAMSILFMVGLTVCYQSELNGNPVIADLGITQNAGSMGGKEVRFGAEQSALFSTVTTSFTTGTVNNTHDTLTPLGGIEERGVAQWVVKNRHTAGACTHTLSGAKSMYIPIKDDERVRGILGIYLEERRPIAEFEYSLLMAMIKETGVKLQDEFL